MTTTDLWHRFTKYYLTVDELGFALDISRMRFDDSFLAKHEAAVQHSFQAMEELERGAIANPDEKRMVGHYWLRDPKLAPTADLAATIENTTKVIKAFAADIHSGKIVGEQGDRFTKLLLIGIGGSALGPQLVSEALKTKHDPIEIVFLDNTDPDGFSRAFHTLSADLGRTLTVVISKSGGTVETENGMLETARAYSDRGLTFSKHAVAITCPGSKLDKLATDENWLKRIELWDWVGGRTSIFSSVGLFPAALQGLDIDQFVAGARIMDQVTRKRETAKNPAALLALMWFFAGDGKGKKDMVVLPYKDRLVLFSKYLQQLVMESLGKEKNLAGEVVHQGIAVYGNKGSTDQHAYVQQLREGVNNFFATFVEVLGDFVPGFDLPPLEVKEHVTSGDYLNGFFQGTRRALYENDRDSITITIDSLTPKTLGALIALYDRAVGLYANIVGINAYHQPGVEAGKKAAEEVVSLQQRILATLKSPERLGKTFSAEEISAAIGDPNSSEAVFKILQHIAVNKRYGIHAEGDRHPTGARFGAK